MVREAFEIINLDNGRGCSTSIPITSQKLVHDSACTEKHCTYNHPPPIIMHKPSFVVRLMFNFLMSKAGAVATIMPIRALYAACV